jgi:2-polyprenyl-3-methyl-5-hydroxy-6-metoxy-1,4-benzoquinol methylase
MQRDMTPEIMDEPGTSREDLAASLRFIRFVNRRLGGSASLIRCLRRWSRRWPRDRPITLLDIGTGSADIPVDVRRWATRSGFEMRITAVDLHPTTLDLAREHVEKSGVSDGIDLVEADALRLADRFDDSTFDYVHAGMFLHHFPEIEILTLLRIMDRLARAGIIWNDLLRSHLALAGIHVLTVGQPEIVRHDARVSVRKGFTTREVEQFRRRLELGYTKGRISILGQRFTLAGQRPGAWSSPLHR